VRPARIAPGDGVKTAAKRWLRSGLNRFGYDVRRIGPAPKGMRTDGPAISELLVWLARTQAIVTLIDIGANTGDFAEYLASVLRPQRVYAFEPVPACLPALRAKAATVPGLTVFDVALSDEAGEATFFVNSYRPSSSLLHVAEVSRTEFPGTAGETPIRVRLARLDDVLNAPELQRDIFIKIDVQGVEDRVIRGGVRVFGAAQSVLVEMSFVRMYEQQPLFEEIHDLLVGLGLRFAGMRNQVSSARTGQPLFAHCLYLRDGPARATLPR
jgi:FkbM family methyltransferase